MKYYTCKRCNTKYPRTDEYFHKAKNTSDGLTSQCKDCNRLRARQWARDNPERNRERVRQWADENPDKVAQYRKDNAERIAKVKRQWRRDNPDKVKEHKRRDAINNRESYRKRHKEWRDANPEHVRQYSRKQYRKRKRREGNSFIAAHNSKRRALKMNNGGEHTKDDIDNLMELQHGRCGYCGITLFDDYHIDHMIPLSRGGRNDVNNILLTCPSCNLEKHNKTIDEWASIRDW